MYEEYESKMKKTIEVLQTHYSSVRAGRANPSVLDQIKADYYGTPTPLNQIASISTPDPRTLLIQPWDASSLKVIEKAIITSDLGINPANDGRVLRLVFPQPTQERRKELIKQARKTAEESKVAIRNIRRDAVEAFKASKKKGEITEDDLTDSEKDLQKLTDTYIAEIDKVADKKEAEISEI
jgi:ribosome recycling factor